MAWSPQTVKAQGIPPAVLPPVYLHFLFFHSHGGTGWGFTHNPFRPSHASFSSRLQKQSASIVLASLRSSTYPRGYALYLGVVVHETDGP
jgi:hypothetical protein